MSHYPPKEHTIDVLLEVARRAANESTAEHPEDIACEIANAVEHGAITLAVAHKLNRL